MITKTELQESDLHETITQTSQRINTFIFEEVERRLKALIPLGWKEPYDRLFAENERLKEEKNKNRRGFIRPKCRCTRTGCACWRGWVPVDSKRNYDEESEFEFRWFYCVEDEK